MYYCDKCRLTTPAACRTFHANEAHMRDLRYARMGEIRTMLEAMTDEEFRDFNRRMSGGD